MLEPDDHLLLQEFARSGSEAAFAVLVERYVNLVCSTALRSTGNPNDAEEITQAVFIILARKAGKLSSHAILSGWLYKTTRLTAANFKKGEGRRQRREQEAYMQSTVNEPNPAAWEQIAPLLDEAMGRLGDTDRTAIVLHYFENKTAAEVAVALRTTEAAVYKRTNRALEKLNHFFAKNGVSSTASIIAETIVTHSIQVAPAMLAKSVTAVAITKGASASASTLTLAKATINLEAWSVTQTIAIIAVGSFLAASTFSTIFKWYWPDNSGTSFEAQGTLTYETGQNHATGYIDVKHFIVTRRGNLWRIRTTTLKQERTGIGGPVPPPIDQYEEMSFDGTDIYTLEQRMPPQPTNYLGALGRVEPAVSPPGLDTYEIFPVWLAYCSAPYFKNLKTEKAVSPTYRGADFLDSPAKRAEMPAKWNLHNKFFADDITWMADGTYTAIRPDGKSVTEKYPPPYDQGFIQARYEVTSWTNWNGMAVPINFKIVTYYPYFRSNSPPKLDTGSTYTGSLDQIQELDNFSPIPALTTKTYITDWRLKDHKRFHNAYVSTNRWDVSDARH